MCASRIPDLLDLSACDYIKRNDGIAKYNIVLETPRLSDRPGNDEECRGKIKRERGTLLYETERDVFNKQILQLKSR